MSTRLIACSRLEDAVVADEGVDMTAKARRSESGAWSEGKKGGVILRTTHI